MKYSLIDHIAKQWSCPDLKIPEAHLQNICKFKQKGACRYIGLTTDGYFCAKNTDARKAIDVAVESGNMSASGNNCDGFECVKQNK